MAWRRPGLCGSDEALSARRRSELSARESVSGGMYQKGGGVPRDDVEAVRLYRRARRLRATASRKTISVVMYATGQAVPQDDVQAYMWFSISLAQGNGVVDEQSAQRAAALMSPGPDRRSGEAGAGAGSPAPRYPRSSFAPMPAHSARRRAPISSSAEAVVYAASGDAAALASCRIMSAPFSPIITIGGVGVAGHDCRHDRGVDHAQTARCRARAAARRPPRWHRPHAAGAGRMEDVVPAARA